MRASLFSLALTCLVACTPQAEHVWPPGRSPAQFLSQTEALHPPPTSAGAVNLLAPGVGSTVVGVAAAAAALSPPKDAQQTLLQADFEAQDLGPLRPTASSRGTVRRLAGDDGGGGRGVLQLKADKAVAAARSGFIAVQGYRRYRLQYRIWSAGIEVGKRIRTDVVSVIPFAMDAAVDRRVLEADPAKAAAHRRGRALGFSVPDSQGRRGWTPVSVDFWFTPEVTDFQVALDLGRKGTRSALAKGEVRLDDIRLTAIPESRAARHIDTFDTTSSHLPLGRVTLASEATVRGQDSRTALFLPAPSHLAATVPVPAGARLGFAAGFLPGMGREPGRGHPVTFVLEAVSEAGVKRLWERTLPAQSRVWRDFSVDLSALAGQTVELRLGTRGRAGTGDPWQDWTRVGESGAVVADVWLQSQSASDAGRTVVWVVLDTVSAKRCSLYGYEAPTTPNLRRIAKHGASFTRAMSASPWTLAAFGSLMTARTSAEHGAGVLDAAGPFGRRALPARERTLAEVLSEAGWQTQAWINNPFLTRTFGVHQGFQRFFDYGTRNDPDAAQPALSEAVEVIAQKTSADRLLLFHIMEPHAPYKPSSESYRAISGARSVPNMTQKQLTQQANSGSIPSAAKQQQLRQLHEAALRDADRVIGRLWDAARRHTAVDQLMFVVTADHGEEFWEHDRFEHGHSVYDELVHVPLLIAPAPAQVRSDVVSTRRIAATVLAFAGAEQTPDSLLSSARIDRAQGSRLLYGPDRYFAREGDRTYIYNDTLSRGSGRRAREPEAVAELYRAGPDGQNRQDLLSARAVGPEDLAAMGALHEAALNSFAKSGEGKLGLFWQTGSAPQGPVQVTLALEAGRWPREIQHMQWPGGGGQFGEAEVEWQGKGDTAVVTFDTSASVAWLGLPAGAAVRVRARASNGDYALKPLSADGDGAVLSPATAVPPQTLLGQSWQDEPTLWVALIQGSGPAPEKSSGGNEDVEEQLRALGYTR